MLGLNWVGWCGVVCGGGRCVWFGSVFWWCVVNDNYLFTVEHDVYFIVLNTLNYGLFGVDFVIDVDDCGVVVVGDYCSLVVVCVQDGGGGEIMDRWCRFTF